MAITLGNVSPPKLTFFLPGTTTPLAGGKLFTYAGGTTTKQTTYSDDNQTPNTNPIILDANGQCTCFVDTSLKYDFTLAPSTDTDPPTNAYWTVSNMGFGEMISAFATLSSPTFTGAPKAPTAASGDSSTTLANTQFVQQAISTNNASPSFTGTPTVPTATAGTNTTQAASTAFVGAEITRAPQSSFISATGAGTFTVPANVTQLRVLMWGGGGGGGGASTASAGAAGGGGGGYVEAFITTTGVSSISYSVGAGGTAGTGSGNGGAGGNTTIAASSLTAGGGGGGTGSASGGTTSSGAGGSATGGYMNFSGGAGEFGNSLGGSGLGGQGGGSFGAPVSTGAGVSPGGGGGGGGDIKDGYAGANGAILFEWLRP